MESRSSVPAAKRMKLAFTYDSQHRRIRKQVWQAQPTAPHAWILTQDRRFHYQGWNLIAEADPDKTFVRTYLWGLDLSGTFTGAGGTGGLLAITIARGPANVAGTHLVTTDGQGNVTGLINATTGQTTAAYTYDPFGQLLSATGPAAAANPVRFSTRYEDPETSLLYYGYRFLHPATGRWLNRDPLGEAGGVNLYGFAANNPTDLIDRLGLDFVWDRFYVEKAANSDSVIGQAWWSFVGGMHAGFSLGATNEMDALSIAHEAGRMDDEAYLSSAALLLSKKSLQLATIVAVPAALPAGASASTIALAGGKTAFLYASTDVVMDYAIADTAGFPQPRTLEEAAQYVLVETEKGIIFGVVANGVFKGLGKLEDGLARLLKRAKDRSCQIPLPQARPPKSPGDLFEENVKNTFKKKIIQENEILRDSAGKVVGEIDFETVEAIVEVGISLRGKVDQLHKLAEVAKMRAKRLDELDPENRATGQAMIGLDPGA